MLPLLQFNVYSIKIEAALYTKVTDRSSLVTSPLGSGKPAGKKIFV